MKNTNFAKSHLLANEVDADLDVLGTAVVDRVGCHVDSANVIAVDDYSNLQRNIEFLKKLPQPATLGDDVSIARCSASALDRDTVVCRLDDQDTRLSPKKTQKPDVERRESRQPVQSASE
jgi:hypothetical protein